ncbi:Biotin carboxylase of acetyl-CoA carboxylase [Dehalobacter sp. UNSWDHB]|uniref:acetyl-CoA carboxylase biotin carboxylase subunit n=1 Tax=unclassified Dehalobacter TaxID=2635733 RepID=UPI0003878C8F|nr:MULTISPECIES: acetyl-CoA carboxylase biotin carboxylase subunit [unclassified Dehalobacter]EQB20391.1 Biotin carboxylase of acetyl-CoA carboxylase [Dehalobacter sp. UNSWDHB]RJE47587.1 acetyl-CoA carboxylase biotin carboxylase subunit [Dehalobacter sp. MCB1]TCX56351.1 acetyl-CoA carboxylase biotin carboxylase subunit [Dehalobacter sp. 12DCB1]
MFKKILIANRGEIAVRIIRACREIGVTTVAVYSEADRNSLHVDLADEAVCIGPARAKDSYLNTKNIISATVLTGAEAIHPGFGFLAENSKFAEMCKACHIAFIGPDPEVIEMMGNKAKARQIMGQAGVPLVPGIEGVLANFKQAEASAERIGYPVMLKASAGGGGKGIRIVWSRDELKKAYDMAKKEAQAAFDDDSMYLEKYLVEPRHIEFQILADHYGNVIHLGERDCSIQRRNQKVIEEAPSTVLSDELRQKMGDTAVRAAQAVGYKSAGTIEFLLDNNGDYYFMEMNTRIQVEHPVTELVTGIDIVKEQLKIASGEQLNIRQDDVQVHGHAIECRINAENPALGFRPSPGKVNILFWPGGNGVRLDSALYSGYDIPPTYDSMIAKLITHGQDRNEAIGKMRRALDEFIIEGIDTNIEFLFQILNNPKFIRAEIDTSFIAKEFDYGA